MTPAWCCPASNVATEGSQGRLLPHLNWKEVPSTTKGESSSSYEQARDPSVRNPLRKSSQKKGLPSIPGLRFLSSPRDCRWLAAVTRDISPQVSRLESPFVLTDLRPPPCSQVARTWEVLSISNRQRNPTKTRVQYQKLYPFPRA